IRFAVDPHCVGPLAREAHVAASEREVLWNRQAVGGLAPFALRSIPTAWGPSPGKLMSPLPRAYALAPTPSAARTFARRSRAAWATSVYRLPPWLSIATSSGPKPFTRNFQSDSGL